MLKILCIGLLLSWTNANAYLVSIYNKDTVKFNMPTRILVTGDGKDQETQFEELANSKALKYSELYPSEQIVLIAKNEGPNNENINLLKNWGFHLLYNKKIFSQVKP